MQSYLDFFLATAGASGALIGLLFVAISVAPDRAVGPNAVALHQVRATMALTCFVSTLVLSLIALIPHTGLGWPAALIGAGGVFFFATSLRRLLATERGEPRLHAFILLTGFLLVMLLLVSSGIRLLIHPHTTGALSAAAGCAIALLAIGIDRSWELVGGRSTGVTGMITDLVVEHDHRRTESGDKP